MQEFIDNIFNSDFVQIIKFVKDFITSLPDIISSSISILPDEIKFILMPVISILIIVFIYRFLK